MLPCAWNAIRSTRYRRIVANVTEIAFGLALEWLIFTKRAQYARTRGVDVLPVRTTMTFDLSTQSFGGSRTGWTGYTSSSGGVGLNCTRWACGTRGLARAVAI